MPLEVYAAPRASGPLGPLWDLLFPARCLGCGRREFVLCPGCAPSVPWLPAAVCPRCNGASPEGRHCQACARGRLRQLASARAACEFRGVVRTAIHQLKFRHVRALAPFLARLLAEALAVRPIEADLVIPVPLAPRRARERGYNQAALIAAALAELTALPHPSEALLAKPRDTSPQVGLSAPQRRRNLQGAFSCPSPGLVTGKRCLLLDDVMTTGSTLEACAETLGRAGAAHVLALVVARG